MLISTEDINIKATSLKRQMENSLDDFKKAKYLNNKVAGFEYYPEHTPYYELMSDILIERRKYCDKINAEKGK